MHINTSAMKQKLQQRLNILIYECNKAVVVQTPLAKLAYRSLSIVHVFLPKVCQKGIFINKDFEAYVTHVWMNSSFVIGQFFVTTKYFITSATTVT